jgi:signal transduction histidine kinase
MGRLLEDLLILARADASTPDADDRRQSVNLTELGHEAAQTAQALASGQRLTFQAEAPVLIEANPDRILQLLLILLDNALRHTPAGGEVAILTGTQDGQALVRIGDTGEGIDPEHLPHIFERFYRIDSARNRSHGGTGLGLAIAEAIVRAHDGTISATSAPGSGTTFTVRLPMVRGSQSSHREKPEPPQAEAPAPPPSFRS